MKTVALQSNINNTQREQNF